MPKEGPKNIMAMPYLHRVIVLKESYCGPNVDVQEFISGRQRKKSDRRLDQKNMLRYEKINNMISQNLLLFQTRTAFNAATLFIASTDVDGSWIFPEPSINEDFARTRRRRVNGLMELTLSTAEDPINLL